MGPGQYHEPDAVTGRRGAEQRAEAAAAAAMGVGGTAGRGPAAARRPPALRSDAQANMVQILRAAREVFSTHGYDASVEMVARQAGVGIGTVYRRFTDKQGLVHRILLEETLRLTARAEAAAATGHDPWTALATYVRDCAVSGAGRLLPPHLIAAAARQVALRRDAGVGGLRAPLGRVPTARGGVAAAGRPRATTTQRAGTGGPGQPGQPGPPGPGGQPAGRPTPLGAQLDGAATRLVEAVERLVLRAKAV
ncbi:TetR/AcrR family transcriptional regulator, partial [Allostreptomyces psammosilenae]